jgi:hypothetical protein
MNEKVCPDCGKHNSADAWNCTDCGRTLSVKTLVETDRLETTPAQTQKIPEYRILTPPSCKKCGRQDDTLRMVTYPYVVSFMVVTHRNAFAGLMCRKHRYLYWFLASAVTATIGWIGIPFGFIFTPIALFDLALGGIQPKENNFLMLKTLAKYKADQGDIAGTIKCLEASLQFRDDEETLKELQQYRLRLFVPAEEISSRTKFSSTVYLLLGAAIIGTIIGVLDYVISGIFSAVIPGEVDIFFVILSWALFFVLAFIGGLALSQLIEWVITRTSLKQALIAIGISGISGFLAVYSIAQATAMSDYLRYLIMGGGIESALDAIRTGLMVTTLGGYLWISWQLDGPYLAGTIYVILIAGFLVYYLCLAVRTAIKTVSWQRRLAT